MADKPECANDLLEVQKRNPEAAALGDPVQLRLQDLLVLLSQLMSRLR